MDAVKRLSSPVLHSHSWRIEVGGAMLVNVQQMVLWEEKAPTCSVGQFLWCKYFHHGLFQATTWLAVERRGPQYEPPPEQLWESVILLSKRALRQGLFGKVTFEGQDVKGKELAMGRKIQGKSSPGRVAMLQMPKSWSGDKLSMSSRGKEDAAGLEFRNWKHWQIGLPGRI